MASQSGSSFTAARVTYIVTSSALSATGSSSAPTVLPPPLRRASQPSTASDSAGGDEQEERAGESVLQTSQTATGTAHSRAKVMTFGRVSSVAGALRPTCDPSGIGAGAYWPRSST